MLLNNKKCPNCASYYDPTLIECPSCHKTNELYEQRRIPDSIMFFHPAAQIGLFLAGFSFAGMLISEIIAALLLRGVADKGLAGALTMLFTYLLMLAALLTIAFTSRTNVFIKKFTRPLDYLFGLLYAIGIVLSGLLIGVIVSFFYNETNSNQEIVENMIGNYPIFAVILICFLGPICEELTYRVGLYSFLRRINKVLAIVVSTIVFAMIHYDFTSANYIAELWSLPSYLSCGLILSLAYEHRGPACSIAAHMTYNAIALIIVIIGQIYG